MFLPVRFYYPVYRERSLYLPALQQVQIRSTSSGCSFDVSKKSSFTHLGFKLSRIVDLTAECQPRKTQSPSISGTQELVTGQVRSMSQMEHRVSRSLTIDYLELCSRQRAGMNLLMTAVIQAEQQESSAASWEYSLQYSKILHPTTCNGEWETCSHLL